MELPSFNTFINFSRHRFCCFTVASLFGLDKSTAWDRCPQHPCYRNLCKITQASKNSSSNVHHFLSDLLTHSRFHSMLFTLPCYQFPYTVMNRCFYLRQDNRQTHQTIKLLVGCGSRREGRKEGSCPQVRWGLGQLVPPSPRSPRGERNEPTSLISLHKQVRGGGAAAGAVSWHWGHNNIHHPVASSRTPPPPVD